MLPNTLLLLFLLSTTLLRAQPAAAPKYWILLRDKANASGTSATRPTPALSPDALQNRRLRGLVIDDTDLPLSPAYLTRLRQLGITPTCSSRWLNAVSARLSPAQHVAVSQLPFVDQIVPLDQIGRAHV